LREARRGEQIENRRGAVQRCVRCTCALAAAPEEARDCTILGDHMHDSKLIHAGSDSCYARSPTGAWSGGPLLHKVAGPTMVEQSAYHMVCDAYAFCKSTRRCKRSHKSAAPLILNRHVETRLPLRVARCLIHTRCGTLPSASFVSKLKYRERRSQVFEVRPVSLQLVGHTTLERRITV
jgi:hypothetical protein